MELTKEQKAAVAAIKAGESIKIEAVAGSGKTATLAAAAAASESQRKLYLVFNRDMANAARSRLPKDTRIMTLNALAFAQVVTGKRYASKWHGGFVGSSTVARRFGSQARPYARAALATLESFFNSADATPALVHVPDTVEDEEREYVLLLAQTLWEVMRDPEDPFPLTHGAYVKIWQLSQPHIPADVVFVDEAQDLNPALVGALQNFSGQLVLVGDPHQQIYGFRGAVNAMNDFQLRTIHLPRSFRFGPNVARLAQRLLRYGGRDARVEGAGSTRVSTMLFGAKPPLTVLARTNLGALEEALKNAGRPISLHADWRGSLMLLIELDKLRRRKSSDHPQLKKHRNFRELVAAANARKGRRWLLPYLEFLDRNGRNLTDRLATVVDSLVSEESADYVIATLHRAKGGEWDRVRIARDFKLPAAKKVNDARAQEEINTSYVALTRARRHLDLTHNRELAV